MSKKLTLLDRDSPVGDEPQAVDWCKPESAPWSESESARLYQLEHVLLGKKELLRAIWVLVNALTILDLVLSRPTKPWRIALRILYRTSRANLRVGLLWFVWFLWVDFGHQPVKDKLADTVRQLALTPCGVQLQYAWLTIESYPVVSSVTFGLYNLMVGWIACQLMPRSDIRRGDSSAQPDAVEVSVFSAAAAARDLSRWSLLVDLLFRPVSFGTAHNLADLDYELDDSMELLIERLALPNLWLTPVVPTDYLKYLPVWQFGRGWDNPAQSSLQDTVEQLVDDERPARVHLPAPWSRAAVNHSRPYGMIPCCECAICLDKYRSDAHLCGLPCGHHFHHDCIMIWLQRDNHHCPICRWPAYRSKGAAAPVI